MSQITVSNLTFSYEGSYDNIFENVSFQLDTDWKLGFIGRNGKGKTTFLCLLQGKQEYQGSIKASVAFDYFPYEMEEGQEELAAAELFEQLRPGCEMWKVLRELDQLELDAECLYRPFCTLSHGERTKAMLALLFSQENFFLLVDEPTNHLDIEARQVVKEYLRSKKGFILVSHDRELLDACIDHVLVLNRKSIGVEKGNFSIKAVLGNAGNAETSGRLEIPAGLRISYVNQDTSGLSGGLKDYARMHGLDESMLKALLRQLDFERTQFDKRMEEYSEGQKKKVLLATSLLTPAHLYIWDEPLNFIDVFSRMQLEQLILKYQPTMLLVEHDTVFGAKVATRIVDITRTEP